MPLRDGHSPLRGPVLVAGLICDMKQNPEAARAVSAVEFGPESVGKAMAHAAAVGLGSVAEEPGVARAGRMLRGE